MTGARLDAGSPEPDPSPDGLPVPRAAPTATLLIATYNRARYLRDTLQSIAALQVPAGITWDVLVVDNNSSDETREVVEQAAAGYPVPLRYMFEGRQGKSIALNAAMETIASQVIVFSDDDVRVPAGWLEAAVAPLLARTDIDYVGGPVRPMWSGPRPSWLQDPSLYGGVLAVLDYGAEPFIFEDRKLIPLGVNMAVRRSLIARVGGFHPALGRTGKSLLGQEQAEFFLRTRRAGIRGLYVPGMWLEHLVAVDRLRMGYFLRWWFWKGISHARWYRMHHETELGVDLRSTPTFLGVPRFFYRTALQDLAAGAGAVLRRRPAAASTRLCMFVYFLGHCREAWVGPPLDVSAADAQKKSRPGSLPAGS